MVPTRDRLQRATETADRTLLFALVAGYVLYAAAFIRSTSFVIGATRYFSLFDDAMVSMQFAKHLASGRGLVWNAGGPRVEGYSNPLWVLYMSAFHRIGLPAAKISLAIQLSGAAAIALTMVLAWRLTKRLTNGSPPAAAAAAAFVGFFLPLNNWSLQGTEVGALALLLTYAAWLACDRLEHLTLNARLYVILGIVALVRPDGIIPSMCFLVFLSFADRTHRLRHLVLGGGMLLACVVGQTAFRFWYFGDLLPNTYYLKMTGFPSALRIGRGLAALMATAWRMNFLLWLAVFTSYAFGRDRRVLLLLAVVGSVAGYSVFVGGDAWEAWGGANRYLCTVMPIAFVLLATAMHEWYDRVVGSAPDTGRDRIVFGMIACCVLVNLNLFTGQASLGEATLLRPPFVVDINERMVRVGLALHELTDAKARVAVTWAGALPYFADRESIDLLGKTDRVIAHEPMHLTAQGLARWLAFHPGHLKWNYDYSIGTLEPDVITDVWLEPEVALPYLRADYREWRSGNLGLWLRRGSLHVNWEAAARLGSLTDIP
ncbi:MAG: hypothetical protein ABJA98_05865 [Acidobacteriota bacterium]